MRVAVDGASWTNPRGYGRFCRGIVRALALREGIEVVVAAPDPTLMAEEPFASVATPAGRGLRAVGAAGVRLGSLRADVVFFPSVDTWAPVLGAPTVVTIHDALPERFGGAVLGSRANRLRWWLKIRAVLATATRIATVSDRAARDVRTHLGVAEARLDVLDEAADPAFAPPPPELVVATLGEFGLHEPYVLFVGGASRHKGLRTLLDALALDPSLRVAIAGPGADDPFENEATELQAEAEARGLANRLRWLGHVPDASLACLYAGADALALPSLGEGFGLPAIEAMACGCPVAASVESGVQALGPAVGFPAGDAPALLHAIQVAREDRGRLAEAGIEAAAARTWDHAADLLAASLRRAGGRG